MNNSELNIMNFEYYCRQLPYSIMPDELYTPEMLFDRFDMSRPKESFGECWDTRVYQHVLQTGKVPRLPGEIGARAIHDARLKQLLMDTYAHIDRYSIVGVMGGHSLGRDTRQYRQVVDISKRLTEMGRIMISGGGPGAMEATHVGAWMAGRTDEEVGEAIAMLSVAPRFEDEGWLLQAFRVRERFPLLTDYKSLAVPTFFYGHEPPTVFATDIAKFFDNSQREDLILTASFGGLIFMPGSAGTLQEVFQEIVQDHYMVYDESSPLIFVDKDFWTRDVPVYPFIQHMIENGRYKNLRVSVHDSTEEVIRELTISD